MEIRLPIARFRMEADEFKEFTMKLDSDRRLYHESAINACNILNRMCAILGLDEKFYEGDVDDRYQVADFCITICEQLYNDGRKINIQDLAAEGTYIEY